MHRYSDGKNICATGSVTCAVVMYNIAMSNNSWFRPFILCGVHLLGPKSKLLSELKGLGETLLHAEAHLVKVVNESSQVS